MKVEAGGWYVYVQLTIQGYIMIISIINKDSPLPEKDYSATSRNDMLLCLT